MMLNAHGCNPLHYPQNHRVQYIHIHILLWLVTNILQPEKEMKKKKRILHSILDEISTVTSVIIAFDIVE